MANKICGNCKHYLAEMYHCQKNDVMAEAHNFCEDFEPKLITSGDLIRQMSNDELAELDKCDWCVFFDGVLCHKKDDQCCAEGIKPYLDAPAESGEMNE